MSTYKTRVIGNSRVIESDNFAKLISKIAFAEKIASKAGAQQAIREARDVLKSRGDGTWPGNADATIKRKGHDKEMIELGTLAGALKIQPLEGSDLAVGFFDETHPRTGGLTMGELANIHEFQDRPWLSKVADNPTHADAVMSEMMAAFWAALERGGSRGGITFAKEESSNLGQFDFSGVV